MPLRLFRPYNLQLLRAVHKIVCVCFGHKLPRVRLLHKILIPLLLRKPDRIFFVLEAYMRALHEICRRLPAHQGILPPVAFAEDIPVHSPMVPMPVSGLCSGFGGPVDPILACELEGTLGDFGEGPYRTVRACSSIGAPESTAAATTSPSSLPFITRFGMGVNSLARG